MKQIQTRGIHSFLEWMEASLIAWALDQTAGSRKAAANLLGMKRTTLVEKLRRRAMQLQFGSKPPLRPRDHVHGIHSRTHACIGLGPRGGRMPLA